MSSLADLLFASSGADDDPMVHAGDEDFLLKVCVKDIAELEQLLLRDLSASGIVGRVKTTLVLSSSKLSAPIPVADPTTEGA